MEAKKGQNPEKGHPDSIGYIKSLGKQNFNHKKGAGKYFKRFFCETIFEGIECKTRSGADWLRAGRRELAHG